MSKLRKTLFWDTDVKQIDREKQYKAVIQRVYERGNTNEQNEITRFYGMAKVQAALQAKKTAFFSKKVIISKHTPEANLIFIAVLFYFGTAFFFIYSSIFEEASPI